MANSPRDVALTVSVETVGTNGIKNLQQSLQELAKEGGSAAPEFKALADEIQRLGDQSKLTASVRQLSSDIDAIATAEAKAAEDTKVLRQELSSLSDTTKQLQAVESGLKTEIDEAKRAVFDKGVELKKLRNETAEAGKKSTEYKVAVHDLNDEIIKGNVAVRDLADSYSKAKQETKEAETAERAIADQYQRGSREAEQLKNELTAKNQLLRESKSGLEALGAATENVAAAEGDLLKRYGDLSNAIAQTTEERKRANAEALAAAAAEKKATEEKIAAEKEYKQLLGIINAQITNARKAEIEKIQAAEKAANDERIAAEKERLVTEKSIQDRLVAETKKANDERIEAEKAYRDAVAEEAKRYANKLDIINQQITNAQKAANDKRLADEKATNDARIADEKRVADAAKAVSESLKTVGVRSAAEIRSEIEKVKSSLELLKTTGTLTGVELDSAFAQGGRQIKELERELRGVNGELTTTDRLANLFKTSMGQFAAGNLIANGVMLAAEKVAELGRAFITTMVQGEQLSRGMNAIYKDTKLAASQIDFLRKTSIETGTSFSEISTEFVKFSASMKSANIPLEQSNALFKAVTTASASLGLGAEATAGALNALAQMASKGTVSMEELRQQLGDRLPGVMGSTAKAMGITEGQLVKLVESGKLATRDFIEPFTKGMQDLKGDSDGVIPTLNRFKSALAGIAQDVGAAGGLALMTVTIKALGGVVAATAMGLSVLTEAMFGIAKAVGVATGAIFTLTNPMDALKEIVSEANARLTGQAVSLQKLAGGYEEAAEAAKQNNLVVAATADETRKAEEIVRAHAAAQGLSKVAIDLAADATLNATGNIVKYTTASNEMIEAQGLQTEALKRNFEAVKSEGEALVTIAEISKDDKTIREAKAQALESLTQAHDKLAASQKAEVDLLLVQRKHTIDDATARGLDAEATKTQVDAIDKKLIPAQAELDQIQKAASANRALALERSLEAEALRDNSAKLEEYSSAVTESRKSLELAIEAEKRGEATKDGVKRAQEELSKAVYRYTDAVNDSIQAVDLDTRSKQAALQVASAIASTGQSRYESLAKEARAINDTALATYYEIEAKKQSIKVLQLKMEMERLQNAAALIEIDMKRKLVDASTEEGQAKLKVLDIEKQMIQIKNINNEAIKDQIRSIDAEIIALREGNANKQASASANNADTNARVVNTGVIDNQTSALERQNAAIERKMAAEEKAAELERKRNGVDKEGFVTNKDGQRLVAGSELGSKTGIYNFLKSAGVDNEAVARKLATDFTGGADLTPYDVGGTSGWKQYGSARSGDSLSTALLKAAQDYSFGSDARKVQMRLEAGDRSDEKRKIPKFASGGYHKGGIRLVGENGPELEITGSSQIINAEETKRLLRENAAKRDQEVKGVAYYKDYLQRLRGQLTEHSNRMYELSQDPSKRAELYEEQKNVNLVNGEMSSYSQKFQASQLRLSELNKVQAQLEARLKNEQTSQAPSSVASSTTQTQPTPTAGKQYTVSVNIGSQTTSINTASDSDAQSLVGLLKSLETASKRTI